MSDFTPTEQQVQAVELFLDGGDLKIQALAGAGKTSTLNLCASASPGRGRYLSFNKAIATEAAEKFPRNVACSTAHSLAMRAVGRKYAHRLNSYRMKPWDVASALGVEMAWIFDLDDGGTKELEPYQVAGFVQKTVAAFCMSADHEISASHVPFQRGLDEPGKFVNNWELGRRIVPMARKMWQDLTQIEGKFPFQHNHYLKIWQLDGPVIDADFILFDEAQDANPLMMDIVLSQRNTQKVWVGDSNQQIYSWNGAINAMEEAPAENETWLTESFRFGPEIAEAANLVLHRLGAPQMVTGSGPAGRVGEIEYPDVSLGRTNGAVLSEALFELARGRKVHVVGGVKDLIFFAESAEKLMRGEKTNHHDLACFDSWHEVVKYVEDEGGDDLAQIVHIIESFGCRTLIEKLRMTVEESYADVILSTAHKSKGREWGKVKLMADYPSGPDAADEELRLLYVAATRAQNELDAENVNLSGGPLSATPPLDFKDIEVPAGEPWEMPSGKVQPIELATLASPAAPKVRPRTDRDDELVMARTMLGREVLRVACPFCKSERFKVCETTTGSRLRYKVDQSHVPRVEAALDLAFETTESTS